MEKVRHHWMRERGGTGRRFHLPSLSFLALLLPHPLLPPLLPLGVWGLLCLSRICAGRSLLLLLLMLLLLLLLLLLPAAVSVALRARVLRWVKG